MNQTKKQIKNLKIEKILWWVLWVTALVSLLTVIETYVKGGSDKRDPKWVEMIIVPLYFTIQSNFLAFFVATLVCFKKIKNQNLLRTLAIFMSVNLIVTFVVYWAILFPNQNSLDAFGWVRTMLVHGLTPIFAVAVFIVKYTIVDTTLMKKIVWKWSLIHLLWPIIYLIVAIIIYFSLGGDEKDAIYPFLKIKTNPISFLIYLVSIALFYYGLTAAHIYYTNPQKQKRVRKAK